MGLYFDSTTPQEDGKLIEQGCLTGEINQVYEWHGERVWRPDPTGTVVVDGKNGELTDEGEAYIRWILLKNGRYSCML